MTSFSTLFGRLTRPAPSPATPAANHSTDEGLILSALIILQQQMSHIMSALDDLKAADAKLGTSVAAAVSALNTDTTKLADLATKLAGQAANDDSAELATLAADISAKAAALDAAVNPPSANTDQGAASTSAAA